MIRRPPRSTLDRSSAASDVYKRQPVIYALSKATKTESKSIIKLIRSLKLNDDSNEEKTKIVTEFVNKFGGVDYSIKIANEYRLKALNALSILPDNQSKNSLILFVDFALNRDS